LVSIIVILAVLGALVRTPRRRDLTCLSVGLVAGVLAQIVLGGLVVLFDLAPPLVMLHFSLSMLIVLDAVVLHHRARMPDDRPRVAVVDRDQVRMVRLLAVMAGIVIFLGTVTTASGPHPGSNGNQVVERLSFSLHDAARLHGAAVMLFLAFTLLTIWSLWRSDAPRDVLQRAELLLVLLVTQGAIGYIQYFSRLPVFLVGLHIASATGVWMATVWLNCGLYAAAPAPVPERVLVPA
jgi:cytochrome c oxidase assembly protein subunit 15